MLYRGQKVALAEFLPLDAENWITCGNALRLDWLSICPPTGTGVKHHADDLFHTPLDQAQIDFENEGGETYICGNPPYAGSSSADRSSRSSTSATFFRKHTHVMEDRLTMLQAGSAKAAEYCDTCTNACSAFVTTNSICQGEQVSIALAAVIYDAGQSIRFAHTSFKWIEPRKPQCGRHRVRSLAWEERLAKRTCIEHDEPEQP